MRIRCILLSLLLLFTVSSCSATKSMTSEDIKNIKGLVSAMEQAGIAGYVEAELGEGCVFAQTRWGFDLGVKLRVRAIVRPHESKDSIIDVDPVP